MDHSAYPLNVGLPHCGRGGLVAENSTGAHAR